MTAHDFPELDGMPPEEAVHNHMANISAYAQFDWYEHVWSVHGPIRGHRIDKKAWTLDRRCRESRRSDDVHGFAKIVLTDCEEFSVSTITG
jgi:hypothetical protein